MDSTEYEVPVLLQILQKVFPPNVTEHKELGFVDRKLTISSFLSYFIKQVYVPLLVKVLSEEKRQEGNWMDSIHTFEMYRAFS